MDLKTFKLSLQEQTPPETSHALQALWYDAKGQWDKAHELAQQAPDPHRRLGPCLFTPSRRRRKQRRLLVSAGEQAAQRGVAARRMGGNRQRPAQRLRSG